MTLSKENRSPLGALLAAVRMAWCSFVWCPFVWCSFVYAGDKEEAVHAKEVLAIVTEVSGKASAQTTDSRVPVRVFQVVRDGTSFELAPGAWLEIACEGGVIRIEKSGPVSSEHCRRAVKPARGLAPYQGRVSVWQGSPVLEGWTRLGAYYGVRPVLVRPRCPNEKSWHLGCQRLLKLPSEVVWTEVEGAPKYTLELNDLEPVDVEQPRCRADESTGYRICSRPWPETWQVRPGKARFLHVTAHLDLFDRVSSQKTKIEVLSTDASAGIEEEMAAIEKLGLDAPRRHFALASFLAERKLYNDAVEVLEEALHDADEPSLHLALGDAYVKLALLETASLHYRHALDQLDQEGSEAPELRAAAELGLGWANYLDDRLTPALAHFRTAETLSKQAGLDELAGQAGTRIAEIEKQR